MSFYTADQITEITEKAKAAYLNKCQQIASIWQAGIDKARENSIFDELKKVSNMLFVCETPASTLEQKNSAADEIGRLGYTGVNPQDGYSGLGYSEGYSV